MDFLSIYEFSDFHLKIAEKFFLKKFQELILQLLQISSLFADNSLHLI